MFYICNKCSKPHQTEFKFCKHCRDMAAKLRRDKKAEYERKGLCTKCGISRDSERVLCKKCRDADNASKRRKRPEVGAINDKFYQKMRWAHRMVMHSKTADRKAHRTSTDDYVTPGHLERLRKVQKNSCTYCKVPMQTENRRAPDGLTIQRLDNSLPHSKNNCILACWKCNICRVENGNKEEYITLRKTFSSWKRLTFKEFCSQLPVRQAHCE